jgi:mRNA-degrading endonuclease RelE of RelBE toxin-antitoxin system
VGVDFSKTFNKQFEKLPHKHQLQVKAAVALFLDDDTSREVTKLEQSTG